MGVCGEGGRKRIVSRIMWFKVFVCQVGVDGCSYRHAWVLCVEVHMYICVRVQ